MISIASGMEGSIERGRFGSSLSTAVITAPASVPSKARLPVSMR